MIIGLTGAHRTGKSTLAKAFADKYHDEVKLCLTSASQVFQRLGYSPQAELDFETRLTIQEEILKELTKQYKEHTGQMAITDRTPIDMLAYTLAEVNRQTLTPKLDTRLRKYSERCYDVTNQYFGVLIVVQPGIPLVDDPTKAPATEGYIEHINALICGLVAQEVILPAHYYLARSSTDLLARVDAVDFCFDKAMQKAEQRHYPDANINEITLH